MIPALQCTDDRRRARGSHDECQFNGIDYVEAIAEEPPRLRVYFQEKLDGCGPLDWMVEGGRQNTLQAGPTTPQADSRVVEVPLQHTPDQGWYRLVLRNPESYSVDPRFASAEFRFLAAGSELNDLDESSCPPRQFSSPQIDYLARDYSRIKRLLFDRLSVTMPDWRERHVPDLGVMLIELFAYIGDHLSYQQDAIATEAYLGTARQRISVRRHARLVDYRLHEGCNARTFLHINAPGGDELDPADVVFIAGLPPGDEDPPEAVSVEDLDLQSPPPLVYFEAVTLPQEDPTLRPDDVTDWLEFLRCLVNASTGVLVLLWSSLPPTISVPVLSALYSPPDSLLPLIELLLPELNQALCEVRLAFAACPQEQQRCSAKTRQRIARACPHGCPASTNRAILEDLFPQWIVRRLTQAETIRLYGAHNEIRFYTWDGSQCWLPRGSQRATLLDGYLPTPPEEYQRRLLDNLAPGQLLLLEEVRGSRTGNPEDADPDRRQVVRLTRVTRAFDPVVKVPLNGGEAALPIVEIEWHPDDALMFPLCLSARGRATSDCHLVENVSVARGNIVLVDQGRTVIGEGLPAIKVPATHDPCADPHCCGTCSTESPPTLAPRPFRPVLTEPNLTFATTLVQSVRDRQNQRPMAASEMLSQMPHKAEPQLSLRGLTPSPDSPEGMDTLSINELMSRLRRGPLDLCRQLAHLLPSKRCQEVASLRSWRPDNEQERDLLTRLKHDLEAAITWIAKNDLINTSPTAQEFTVEIDNDRKTHLRFPETGPNKPLPGSRFWVTYRIGNGTAGNVGAGGITHIGFRKKNLVGRGLRVRNPLPAMGGTDPESVASAKLLAPEVTRKLKRAVTADDYALVVRQEFPTEVQAARAHLIPGPLVQRVHVAIDPFDRVEDFEELRSTVARTLGRFTRIGHEVQVVLATEVPIEIDLRVVVQPGYYFEHIRAELLRTFSAGIFPDGTLGFFHRDQRSFGDGIALSELVAAARKVTGVRGVDVTKLQRLGDPTTSALESGLLSLRALEVAVLQRSDGHREKGVITITPP